jgi:glycosyltransferase involved in cell wall biosynthesis
MKILIAIGVPRQREAGAASVVFHHARELERRGHAVDCWFLDDIFAEPVRLKRFEAMSFACSVAKRIFRNRKKYDVVNLHAPWGFAYGLWRRLARPADAPPYVFTMHGSEDRYVLMMKLEHRKGRASHFGWHNRLWHCLYHQTMYDLSVRTASYGAVVNREGWICAELKQGRQPGRVRFVPNGVDESFFVHRAYSQDLRPRLLYVGTWVDRKGLYYLAEAFGIVAREYPAASLTVAGCGGAELLVKNSFAQEVQDRICVRPHVKCEDMPAVYAEHDIFVFPSLMEGMPLTLLEAMAAGMPVVTTNSSGMADVVEDGFNGLIVPPADAEALAKSITRLCESVEMRRKLGAEAENTVRRYTWERSARQMEELLTLAKQEGEKN